jgi:hypothetical protein
VSEVNYSLADYLSDVTALKAERDAAVRERDEAFQQLEEHGRYRLKAAHWKREYDRLAAIVERVKALRAEWNLYLMRSEREEFDRALAQSVERVERLTPCRFGCGFCVGAADAGHGYGQCRERRIRNKYIQPSGGCGVDRIYPRADGMWGPDRRRAGSGK